MTSRTLLYFPIIHTQTDMGALSESIRKVTLQKLGERVWRRKINLVKQFWTDLETFSFAPQGPVTIDRIKRQLNEELSVSHITKAVTFQYYQDMCPTGPGGTSAGKLRNEYLDIIKSLK